MNAEEKRFNPPPPLSTPQEAPWREVEQIIKLLKDISIVLAAGFGGPGAPGGAASLTAFFPLLQRDAWVHHQRNVSTPGTAKQLGSIIIPPGFFDLVVRAKSTNTGNIYVGNSNANASDANERITLASDEAIKLRVSNASLVWVDAAVANEGVEYFVEI